MKILHKLTPIIFIAAFLYMIGTAGALEHFQIGMGQACAQWAASGAVIVAICVRRKVWR